ncbi:hypothetical protein [Myceligenerans crystallogenes]|uniref:Secreted protein n=1 Tax=Myceligenerans crystallogenes TaxID=316335 RepID=A0ABN2N2R0_9MICO
MNSASCGRMPRALPVAAAGVALALLGGGASAAVMSDAVPTGATTGGATTGAGLPGGLGRDHQPGDVFRGLPPGIEPGPGDGATPGVVWAPQAGLVYVVTVGSSSCPLVAEPRARNTTSGSGLALAEQVADIDVEVREPDPHAICTADHVPTTTAVAAPAGKDHGSPVTVRIEGIGRSELAPRVNPGQVGPPAWITADH